MSWRSGCELGEAIHSPTGQFPQISLKESIQPFTDCGWSYSNIISYVHDSIANNKKRRKNQYLWDTQHRGSHNGHPSSANAMKPRQSQTGTHNIDNSRWTRKIKCFNLSQFNTLLKQVVIWRAYRITCRWRRRGGDELNRHQGITVEKFWIKKPKEFLKDITENLMVCTL